MFQWFNLKPVPGMESILRDFSLEGPAGIVTFAARVHTAPRKMIRKLSMTHRQERSVSDRERPTDSPR